MMEGLVALCDDGLRREVARQGWMLRFCLFCVCAAVTQCLSLSSDFFVCHRVDPRSGVTHQK
jgi:hypothetical protein